MNLNNFKVFKFKNRKESFKKYHNVLQKFIILL